MAYQVNIMGCLNCGREFLIGEECCKNMQPYYTGKDKVIYEKYTPTEAPVRKEDSELYSDGYNDGYSNGYQNGADAYDDGRNHGYTEGKEVGQDEVLHFLQDCQDMRDVVKLLQEYGREG